MPLGTFFAGAHHTEIVRRQRQVLIKELEDDTADFELINRVVFVTDGVVEEYLDVLGVELGQGFVYDLSALFLYFGVLLVINPLRKEIRNLLPHGHLLLFELLIHRFQLLSYFAVVWHYFNTLFNRFDCFFKLVESVQPLALKIMSLCSVLVDFEGFVAVGDSFMVLLDVVEAHSRILVQLNFQKLRFLGVLLLHVTNYFDAFGVGVHGVLELLLLKLGIAIGLLGGGLG